MHAAVFHITRSSLHDGEGIRTVVYLKGCPMHCLWCHNPEGLSSRPQLWFYPDRCIGCGRCADVCPRKAHVWDSSGHLLLRQQCTGCGKCAAVCPGNALEICGTEMDAGEVMEIIRRDLRYYRRSGGGVTFSGGECLLWPDFLEAVMRQCKKEGIGITLETALHVDWEAVEMAAGYADAFFCDLKHPDCETHRRLTGVGNERILDNLRRLSEIHSNILVRVPLIPNVNDDEATLRKTAEIVNTLPGVRGIELLKYNNLAGGKGKAIDTAVQIFGQPQDEETMSRKRSAVRQVLSSEKKVY